LAGQPPLDRVVQAEAPFGDQLEDQRAHEGLRDAPDMELIARIEITTRVQVSYPDGELHNAAAIVDTHDGGGSALVNQLTSQGSKLPAKIGSRGRPCRRW
jgi:hypothetical protein